MVDIGCQHLEMKDSQMKLAFLENPGPSVLHVPFCMASNARSCVPTVSPLFVGRL